MYIILAAIHLLCACFYKMFNAQPFTSPLIIIIISVLPLEYVPSFVHSNKGIGCIQKSDENNFVFMV